MLGKIFFLEKSAICHQIGRKYCVYRHFQGWQILKIGSYLPPFYPYLPPFSLILLKYCINNAHCCELIIDIATLGVTYTYLFTLCFQL